MRKMITAALFAVSLLPVTAQAQSLPRDQVARYQDRATTDGTIATTGATTAGSIGMNGVKTGRSGGATIGAGIASRTATCIAAMAGAHRSPIRCSAPACGSALAISVRAM